MIESEAALGLFGRLTVMSHPSTWDGSFFATSVVSATFRSLPRGYGYRRVTAELKRRGMLVNHKRVARMMREDNLLAVQPRQFVTTTDSDHALEVYLNLARRMKLRRPNDSRNSRSADALNDAYRICRSAIRCGSPVLSHRNDRRRVRHPSPQLHR
jgi:transposase InsO family protein